MIVTSVSNSRSEVVAVVVTYQPDESFPKNLRLLSAQVEKIIVVDNGSGGDSAKHIEAAGRLAGVHLICNGVNLGIASALNIGIRHALQKGCQWIATFDQDSAIGENYFQNLFQAYKSYSGSEKVGMIVPGGWGEPGALAAPCQGVSAAWSFVPAAVSSGSLIKGEIFSTAGFFDDAFFIDYVDADFCLRLKKHGLAILSVPAVVLEHELGEKQTRNLCGYHLSFRIHTTWRYYYIMRNRLIVYRRYLFLSPYWVGSDAVWMMLEIGRILALEHGRWPKFCAVFQGVFDGLLGRTGRHPKFPPANK